MCASFFLFGTGISIDAGICVDVNSGGGVVRLANAEPQELAAPGPAGSQSQRFQ
jgi:hypothetical protein